MSELALFVRNFRQNGKGTVEEIGFEEFLVVMSHFRPPSLHMTEDQRESVRREKLRCVCHKSHDHLLVNDSQLVKLIRAFSAVLFNMHDTDNDGTITLEEYRHVSLCLWGDAFTSTAAIDQRFCGLVNISVVVLPRLSRWWRSCCLAAGHWGRRRPKA